MHARSCEGCSRHTWRDGSEVRLPARMQVLTTAPLSPQVRVAERLGYLKGGASDVIGHSWLASFDFDGLVNMTLSPPWVPNLSASDDCSYFDPDLRAEDESKDSSKSGAAAGSSSSTKTVKGVYTQGKGKPTPKFSAAEEEAWAKLCKAYATPF